MNRSPETNRALSDRRRRLSFRFQNFDLAERRRWVAEVASVEGRFLAAWVGDSWNRAATEVRFVRVQQTSGTASSWLSKVAQGHSPVCEWYRRRNIRANKLSCHGWLCRPTAPHLRQSPLRQRTKSAPHLLATPAAATVSSRRGPCTCGTRKLSCPTPSRPGARPANSTSASTPATRR
jgi:hypothetical protein